MQNSSEWVGDWLVWRGCRSSYVLGPNEAYHITGLTQSIMDTVLQTNPTPWLLWKPGIELPVEASVVYFDGRGATNRERLQSLAEFLTLRLQHLQHIYRAPEYLLMRLGEEGACCQSCTRSHNRVLLSNLGYMPTYLVGWIEARKELITPAKRPRVGVSVVGYIPQEAMHGLFDS